MVSEGEEEFSSPAVSMVTFGEDTGDKFSGGVGIISWFEFSKFGEAISDAEV